MKSSIRFKFIIGLSIIFLASGITLNFLIRQVFQWNLENNIKSSMKDIMSNSREYIRYKILTNNLSFNEEGIEILSSDILDYFTTNYNCESQIRNIKGDITESNLTTSLKETADRITKGALDGQSIMNLKYNDNAAYAIAAYPLYYEDKYIGIIDVSKSFEKFYSYNSNVMNIITFIEIGLFIVIFIILFIFTSRITKPIVVLTKGIKRVGEGDYGIELKVKSNDEIGILSKEFMNMKHKIKSQIDDIKKEKEKVIMLEKGRREFFNNVTHELKTPLTAISGYAQMLGDENVKDDEFKKRAVKRVYMESERLHKLVLDLISVSKGLSIIEKEMKPIDMHKLLTEICDDMDIKAKKYYLNLCIDIKEGFILGEINKIRQLVINVVDNAIKYSFTEEKIFIEAFDEKEFYVINVSNRGNKIPQQIYNNIFEPFVKCTGEKEIGSSGLGLYICNEIVKEHNGEIEIKNGKVIKVKIKIPSLRNNLETT